MDLNSLGKKAWKRGRGGSAIIEAVVGVSLLTVGILGILNLITNSMRYNDIVTGRFVAANLAAEGVEVIKNVVDKALAHQYPWSSLSFVFPAGFWDGWYQVSYDGDIVNIGGNPPNVRNITLVSLNLNQEPDVSTLPVLRVDERSNRPLYGYAVGTETPFKRLVRVEWNDYVGGEYVRMDVESRVYWTARGRSYTTVVSDRFYKWRQ